MHQASRADKQAWYSRSRLSSGSYPHCYLRSNTIADCDLLTADRNSDRCIRVLLRDFFKSGSSCKEIRDRADKFERLLGLQVRFAYRIINLSADRRLPVASGCITSAESILITMQSHEEVSNVLAANPPAGCCGHKTPVLSISPQSLASLAASISSSSRRPITLRAVLHRVRAFAATLGFEYVYDTTFARHIALLEHAREFRERRRNVAARGGTTGSASEFEGTSEAGCLPMLASACPGWVCYAEKTKHEILPHISRTKSPQQVMGTLVKGWLARKWGKR